MLFRHWHGNLLAPRCTTLDGDNHLDEHIDSFDQASVSVRLAALAMLSMAAPQVAVVAAADSPGIVAPIRHSVSVHDVQKTEPLIGPSPATFTVTLADPALGPNETGTVHFRTVAGSATGDAPGVTGDYQGITDGVLTFSQCSTIQQPVSVPVHADGNDGRATCWRASSCN